MLRWFRALRLRKLKRELFDLEWSYPPRTYCFDESQMVMLARSQRMKLLRQKIESMEAKDD
jgi:hypothetical protein